MDFSQLISELNSDCERLTAAKQQLAETEQRLQEHQAHVAQSEKRRAELKEEIATKRAAMHQKAESLAGEIDKL